MKKPSTDKQAFFDLLDKAIHTDAKEVLQKRKRKQNVNYSEKRTHQHRTGGALKK